VPADLAALVADLAAETAALRAITDPLTDAGWRLMTPAPGWTIADQVGHLAYFDEAAVTAATDPATFAATFTASAAAGDTPDTIGARYRDLSAEQLRSWFSQARGDVLATFSGLDPSARVPWFGPPMSVASALTARLMETWAHGQDIADAAGERRQPTSRLRHVAHIGVAARPFSYAAHGLPAPSEPVRVELTGPSGELWTWGPPDAPDRVTGPALDFCLLVTQRRHRADTTVVAAGPDADRWLAIAQAFAGPPGAGRAAGQLA
jgi:uncharacterized protein (TIGR03084 family)